MTKTKTTDVHETFIGIKNCDGTQTGTEYREERCGCEYSRSVNGYNGAGDWYLIYPCAEHEKSN